MKNPSYFLKEYQIGPDLKYQTDKITDPRWKIEKQGFSQKWPNQIWHWWTSKKSPAIYPGLSLLSFQSTRKSMVDCMCIRLYNFKHLYSLTLCNSIRSEAGTTTHSLLSLLKFLEMLIARQTSLNKFSCFCILPPTMLPP